MDWLIGIIAFLVLMFIGAIRTRFDTKFDKGFRESYGIFDEVSGKELFFEHVETVERSAERNRTPVTHSKTRTDILDNMAVAGYFPPPVSKSSSSFFNSDTSSVSCHSSDSGGSCGGGE